MKRFNAFSLSLIVAVSSFTILIAGHSLALTSLNQVPNPSVETVSTTNTKLPASWLQGKWGTNTTQFTYDTTGHTGSRSVKVQMTGHTSGDAKWYFTPQLVKAGTTFTYSDYYKASATTSVVAQFDNGAGSYTYVTLKGSVPAATAWTQITVSGTVPTGMKNMTVFHLINRVGTLSLDDVSLTTVTPSTPSIAITAPAAGASLAGTTTLTAAATDTNGISSVQFKVDGTALSTPATTSPYTTSWDTTTFANGSHVLSATATNSLGVTATSPSVTVVVNNQSSPPAASNLIANPSVEVADPSDPSQPQGWLKGGWGTNTSSLSYVTNGGQAGGASLKVQTTAYTDGDVKWYFAPVAVTAGTTLTFSDYYQSTIATDIVAQFDNGNGTYAYTDLGTVAASSAWKQSTASFTVPAGMKNITIFHVLAGVGTLQTDNFSLTQSTPPVPAQSNLIANSSVETADPANAASPLGWQSNSWGTNKTTFSYLTAGGHTGNRALQVSTTSYTDGDGKWFFNPIAVKPDTQYKFSDSYKATTATEVDVAFGMSDGTTRYQIIGLPEPSTDWTTFSTTYTVPKDAINMTVYHLLHGVGTLTLDDENLQPYVPVGFNRALVSLTFDDGYSSQYTTTLPLLKKYGFQSTQFIPTGLTNTSGYMTNTQLQAMATAGNEMAAHSVTHTDMLLETPSQWTTELKNSQSQLAQWTGQTITDFAFPNGLYNAGILAQTKQYYSASRGVEGGLNAKDTFNAYDIKVEDVGYGTTTAEISDWLAQAASTKTWLVLVYHDIDPAASANTDYSITPTQLDAQLSAINASGIAVKTMQQALAEIQPQL